MEIRKKKLNINVISNSNNKSRDNISEDKYYITSPRKSEDIINKDVIIIKNLSNNMNVKKNEIPKLNINSKVAKQNCVTERTPIKYNCRIYFFFIILIIFIFI